MKKIYGKSTRALMKEFIVDTKIEEDSIITRSKIYEWFKTKYPKIKKSTVLCHIIRMTTNSSTRVYYGVKPDGQDDLFYQIDRTHLRLYNKEKDPKPIYPKEEGEETVIEEEYPEGREFAYEKDLRNYLSKNLTVIEQGLQLYEDEGIVGIEFPAANRFIDILAVDSKNNLVVIELKVSRGSDKVFGQLNTYIGWIKKNLAEPSQKVRGIIIAKSINDDLKMACSNVDYVELFEYELLVTLNKIKNF